MPTTTDTWLWYDPSTTYTLATSDSAAFQAQIIAAGPIDLSTLTYDAAWQDTDDSGAIDDLDRLPGTDLPAFDPPAGEGITIDGTLQQVRTFASFNAVLTTNDGGTVDLPIVAYQFNDGSVAYRFDANGSAIINDAGIARDDVASIQLESFRNYFRSAGVEGHSTDFPCYVAGTLIATDRGAVAVEALRIGDRVGTPEHGYQPIRWIGTRTIALDGDAGRERLRPVRIAAGVLDGAASPHQPLLVSPQHRMLLRSRIAQRMFGADEVLVPATALLASGMATRADDLTRVTYVHFLCDSHQIVMANGALSESLYLGQEARRMLGAQALAEIMAIFPELDAEAQPAAAPMIANRRAQALLARHQAKGRPVIEARRVS